MVRAKRIIAGLFPLGLPCAKIIIEIELDRPIRDFRELKELGLSFYDRTSAITPKELMKLLMKLGVAKCGGLQEM